VKGWWAADRRAVSRFLRFALIGAAGFAVNEAALWLALHVLRLDPYAGGVFSFLVAVTFTWWGNRNLTFRAHAALGGRAMLAEWLKFIGANGVGFFVNYGVYAALIAFAPKPLGNPFVALAVGTLGGLAFNYVLSSRLVFRPKLKE
jgi:putative flippase GtrA